MGNGLVTRDERGFGGQGDGDQLERGARYPAGRMLERERGNWRRYRKLDGRNRNQVIDYARRRRRFETVVRATLLIRFIGLVKETK